MKLNIKPEIYQWSGIAVSSILSVSVFLLLFFGTRGWLDQFPNKPLPILPLGLMAPFEAIALFMSGFGARIVMGNVSGNPDVVLCLQKFFNVDPRAGRMVVFLFLMTTYWAIVNGFLITFNN